MQSREADFDRLTEIGKGAFSSVYSCKNKFDEKCYALKKITIKPPKKRSMASSPYEKVLEEVRHLSSCNHPNVVRYYGCWVTPREEDQQQKRKTQPASAKKGPLSKSQFQAEKRQFGDRLSSKSSRQEGNYNGSRADHFAAEISDDFEDKNQPESLYLSSYSDSSNDDNPKNTKLKQKSRFLEVDNLRLSDILDSSKPLSTLSVPIDFYIQTELCHKTLKDYLEERNFKVRLSPASQEWMKESFTIAKQLINGLIFLSAEKIIHRDIKPSNIFVDHSLQIKYGDFGLVKSCLEPFNGSQPVTPMLSPMQSEVRKSSMQLGQSTADLSELPSGTRRARRYSCWDDDVNYDLTTHIGTTMYASPEQMGAAKYTKKSDYYSLGLVLVEVFHPMQTEMERLKLFQSIRKREKIDVGLLAGKAPRLGPLIEGLLRHDSSQRIALDELLSKICSEELRLYKDVFGDIIGPVEFRREGEDHWSDKHVMLLNGKMYIFASCETLKAEHHIELQDFKLGVGDSDKILLNSPRGDASVLITFRNEVVLGFDLKAKESQASQILAKSV